MPFTVVITRNAPNRTRGFLASAMLEMAPGVYVSPNMTKGVRERVWNVMIEWCSLLGEDSGVLMTYPDGRAPGGQAILLLGFPKTDVDRRGRFLASQARRAGGSRRCWRAGWCGRSGALTQDATAQCACGAAVDRSAVWELPHRLSTAGRALCQDCALGGRA